MAGVQLLVHLSTVSFGPSAALALRCTTFARLIVFVSQSVVIVFLCCFVFLVFLEENYRCLNVNLLFVGFLY